MFSEIALGSDARVSLLLNKDPKLVNIRAKDGTTALYHAIQPRKIELVKLLVSKGADINLITDNDGRYPLHCAAVKDREIARFLVSMGANVNAKDKAGFTPLHLAVYCGNRDTAEFLIEEGADVNSHNVDGFTPLCCLAGQQQATSDPEKVKCIELLISRGADVSAKTNDGKTPLARALVQGNTAIADLLRKHGAKE